MEREQMERTIKTLRCYHELFNIAIELGNRIPEKHHETINDLISDIENIGDSLMWLEHDLYYEYLNQ